MGDANAARIHIAVRQPSRIISPETELSVASSFCYIERADGRTIAHWYLYGTYSRKVRAPVDRLPGNSWARIARALRDGKCHREQTAILTGGKGEKVE